MHNSKITVLGVNGGNGVLLHPFLSPEFELLGNIEPRSAFNTPKNIQWEINFPKIPLSKTLIEVKKKVDVIIGAPDCGHSSVLAYSRAKKHSNPKENKSLTLFFEALLKYKPKVFVMENLTALLENYGEDDLRKTLKKYRLKFLSGSVAHYGNSQKTRKRLLIVGIRKKYPKEWLKAFKLPPIDYYTLKTCGHLLNDLKPLYPEPKLCHVREKSDTLITLYAGHKMKVGDIKDVWNNDLPFKKRWPVTGRNFSNAPGVYKNLEDDYPSTARKANRQFNHYGEMMSPRELARIQGVPDSFILIFNPLNPQYWINKGRTTVTKCPPYEMGLYIKNNLIKTLTK